MSPLPAEPQPPAGLSGLEALLLRQGLAELVPYQRRAQRLPFLRSLLLVLSLVGLVGLPLAAILLLLVLALLLEAISFSRQRRQPLFKSLVRPPGWARIRRPFYGPLMLGLVLVGPLAVGEPFLLSLGRAGYVWLCLRILESTVQHPERYASGHAFQDWLRRAERLHGRVWQLWQGPAIVALIAAFGLNLAAPGLWEAVGTADWSRLLIFGGGLYLLALILLGRDLRLVVHLAVEDGLRDWQAGQLAGLGRVLEEAGLWPTADDGPLTGQLVWKDKTNLVARVQRGAGHALTRQLRWGTWGASLTAFLVIFAFLAASAFLVLPREVMQRWVAAGQPGEPELALAFDEFGDLLRPKFWGDLLALDWPDLAREPLPKVAFLEASVLVALFLFRTVAERSALRSLADPKPGGLHWRLGLGLAYLILLERDFQYLYSGLADRQLADSPPSRPIGLRNDVLLAPSVRIKAGVYRAISGYLGTYGPFEPEGRPHTLAIFGGERYAREWALRFLRFLSPPLKSLPAPERVEPERFWFWSGDELVSFSSLEEAQWYGRFVAQSPPDRQ